MKKKYEESWKIETDNKEAERLKSDIHAKLDKGYLNYCLHIIICILSITTVTGWLFYYTKVPKFDYVDITLSEKTQQLEKTFKAFKKLSRYEMHLIWHKKFVNAKYVLRGNILFNEYNCSNSIWVVFEELGAAIVRESAADMGLRLAMSSRKRRSIKYIKTTDIIIFKKNKRGIAHAGWVEGKTQKNKVAYMDVNVGAGGVDYKRIDFNDKRIRGIYEVTLSFWAGNLLKGN